MNERVSVDRNRFMALDALKFGMRTGQRESGFLVIEFGRRPIVEGVAPLAIGDLSVLRLHSELAEMHIAMARHAIRTERTEHRYFDSCCVLPVMATLAGYVRMFSKQLEPRPVVVEGYFCP